MSRTQPIDSAAISGPGKAAAFLLLIGSENAKRLAEYFSEDELRSIFAAADQIEALSVVQLQAVAREFGERFRKNGLVKTPGLVESIFSNMRPDINFLQPVEPVFDTPEEPPPEIPPDWPSLLPDGEERIVAMIESEHPQTGAFVLSRIDRSASAKILKRLPPDIRKEVVLRLADILPVEDELGEEMERRIYARLSATEEGSAEADEDVRDFASIMNELPEDAADEVLNYLAARNERKAELVRKWMFRFEAVETLPREARARLFDRFSAEEMAIALFGASDGIRECMLSVLSQRNRRSVEAELQEASFAEDQVAEARMKIVNTALQLAHEGVISLEPGTEEPQETAKPEEPADG